MMLQDRTWLLIGRKMANEASLQELKELEEILKNNPELHFSLQALTDLWQQSPSHDIHELESAYSTHLNRMKNQGVDHPQIPGEDFVENLSLFAPTRKYRIVAKWSALALFLGLTTAGFFVFSPSRTINGNRGIKPVASEISTRYGSKTNIVLPDGTKVRLNSGSKLTYDKNFGESVRGVSLAGEAYFDVVHNSEKPFVIRTTAMDIKVLGTEFNVKSYPDESTSEASLIKGSLEVTLKDRTAEKIILKPNEKLVVNNEKVSDSLNSRVKKDLRRSDPIISLSHLKYFSLDSTVLETSWVSNRLIFEDESFDEIATKMTRWYGVDFDFKDADIQKLRFTGNFKDESVTEALEAMQITADFGFRISDKHITITKK